MGTGCGPPGPGRLAAGAGRDTGAGSGAGPSWPDDAALTFYARICGWTLARAHARSGDPVALAAYLGDSDAFDKSITDFAQRYADQNERDHTEFVNAVRSGRLEATEGV